VCTFITNPSCIARQSSAIFITVSSLHIKQYNARLSSCSEARGKLGIHSRGVWARRMRKELQVHKGVKHTTETMAELV
jgi:hypothetical protein